MGNRTYSLDSYKKQGNVKVSRKLDDFTGKAIVSVYLHETAVITIDYSKRVFSVNTGGWYTNSTRDVINTALKEIRPDCKVYKSANLWRFSFDNGNREACLECVEGIKYGF